MSCRKSAWKVAASSKNSISSLPPKNIISINEIPQKVLMNKNLNIAEDDGEEETLLVTPQELLALQKIKLISSMNIDNSVSNSASHSEDLNEILEEDSGREYEEANYSAVPVGHNEVETIAGKENDECHHCKNYLTLIIRNQNEILQLLRYGKNSRRENHYFPELPCKTVAALNNFEKLLREKEICRRQFEQCIEVLGGSNLQKCVNNAMYHVMTDEVARNCTWSGITENSYKIKETFIAKIICKVLVARQQSTVVEVYGRIALWLRRVGDRIKAEKKSKENYEKKLSRQNEVEEC